MTLVAVNGHLAAVARPQVIATLCTSLPQWRTPAGPLTPEEIAVDNARFALDLLGCQPSSSCQVRPSRSMSAVAADGPEVPAE